MSTDPWPTELRLKESGRTLAVSFDDGASFDLPAELLRVRSPSAEVQGHAPSQRVTVGGKRAVAIRDLEQVGNYAVRIVFDDGHETGLYTWRFLRGMGRRRDAEFAAYEAELAAKGLTRG
ncbi:MAG: DUF971 domain-containing protein [Hyphomicrobiales bacterium]|nr:DUF971 domain-containing protein [Hyphomicrobiales bacterium]MDE2017114.1 DUF971 domain-containing protein [Hyphomicrobiales bacterium]